MTIYLTHTDLVRALATEFRRAANAADDIAADVMVGLGLAQLDSSAFGDALLLSENLERASSELRNQSAHIDDLELQPIAPSDPTEISVNRN